MTPSEKRIVAWLIGCCTLIAAMVVLGGITRLTHSGLSITEWQPIMGTLPPLDAAQWQEAFHRYQQTPEYRLVNVGMGLEAFKRIFWVEYAHRLLGRTLGAAFLLPGLYFLISGQLERRMLPHMAGALCLGGVQGGLGWYMVRSGLVDVPWVSPYRLTAHLAVAFLLYGWILWMVLGMLPRRPAAAPDRGLHRFSRFLTGLIFLMVMAGGLVAGTKAGFAFNTFPRMGARWIPEGMFTLDPLLRNLFENIVTVQFQHRLLGLLLAVGVMAFWWRSRGSRLEPRRRWTVHLLLGMLLLQITLGALTLLFHVPVLLAAAHQAGALVLFTISLVITHGLGNVGHGTAPAPATAPAW